ncbi:MAG: hypothetical protein AB8B55_22560 [Mariniblastus sp.]
MSRLLLAGLFILSLAVTTGCDTSGGEAQKGAENTKKPAKISGMSGEKTEAGMSGELPPPPKLTIPPGAK